MLEHVEQEELQTRLAAALLVYLETQKPEPAPEERRAEIRRWYAGQAMQGLLANPGGPIQANGMNGWAFVNCSKDDVAGFAFDIADAMMTQEGL